MSDPAYYNEPADQPVVQQFVGSVPRISIHVFCETDQTFAVIQRAAEDRRLARAHTSLHMGGLEGATQFFADSPTPNLLIVESSKDRDSMLADLGRLAAVCDSGTKVIVIGHLNDVILYRELLREGVSEYVVAPLSQLQIIECIAGLYNRPDAAPVGRTFAFVGAKGGSGSSTIAHNVGWTISQLLEENVIVTDLDFHFGTAGLDFNQDPPQGIVEAMNSPDRVDELLLERLLTRCTDRLSLFASPATVDREVHVDGEALENLLDLTRQSVPTVVLDVPHLWSPWVRQTLIHADDVIITAVPDLANLRNAKNIIDLLRAARPNDVPPRLVLNQVGVPKRPELLPQDFASALDLEPTLIVPYDPHLFGTAANNGQMIAEIDESSKTAEAFRHLAKLITGREQVEVQQKSLLAPLLKKLARKKGQ